MRVKVVRDHGLKAPGLTERAAGKEFAVIWKREGGYDVDMAPLGQPGKWGYMHDNEVEETDSAPDLVGVLAEYRHAAVCDWMRNILPKLGDYDSHGNLVIPKRQVEEIRRASGPGYAELEAEHQDRYRWAVIGWLKRITTALTPRA